MMSEDELPEGVFRRASGVSSYLPNPKRFTRLHECPGHHRLFHRAQNDNAINSVKHEALERLMTLSKKLGLRLRAPLSENEGRTLDVRVEGLTETILRLHSYSNASYFASEITQEGYADILAAAALTPSGQNYTNKLYRILGRLKGKSAETHRKAADIYRVFARTDTDEEITNPRISELAATFAVANKPPNPLDEGFDPVHHFEQKENAPDKRLATIAEHFAKNSEIHTKDGTQYLAIDCQTLEEKVPLSSIRNGKEREAQLDYRKWIMELTGSIPYLGVYDDFVQQMENKIFDDSKIMTPDITEIPPQSLPHDVKIRKIPADEVRAVLKSTVPPEKWHRVHPILVNQEEYCRLCCPGVTLQYNAYGKAKIGKHKLLTMEACSRILWKDFLEYVCDVLVDESAEEKWILSHFCWSPCGPNPYPVGYLKNIDFQHPTGVYCDACGQATKLSN